MGYNSGRTGDATKTLLNKIDNHALYKGTAVLDGDVAASLLANSVVIGTGTGCQVTDTLGSAWYNKKAIISINSSGKTTIEEADYVNKDTDQIIAGNKTFSGTTSLSNTTISASGGIPLHIDAGSAYADIEIGGTSATNNFGISNGTITKYGNTQGNGVSLVFPSSTTNCTVTIPNATGTIALRSDLDNKDTIKSQATGGTTSVSIKFWKGTQSQYNSIVTKDDNTLYIILEN